MNKRFIRTLVTGIAATAMIASLTACGNTAATAATEATEAVAETAEAAAETAEAVAETAEAAAETAEAAADEMPDLESEIKAVQDSLTFMGGLMTAEGSAKDIDIAMFRSEQGEIIYIYAVDGTIKDYGMYTTEETTTADGKTYSKITGSDSEYGYYFNEDLVTGIIVDTDGTVYDAVELTEDSARDFVRQSLGG
jgi:hypothetical protein